MKQKKELHKKEEAIRKYMKTRVIENHMISLMIIGIERWR